MPAHDALTGADAVHPAAFVAATDPALDAANYVGAGKWWLDTGATTPVLKYRDATNTAWIAVTTTDHGALAGLGDDDHPQYLAKALVDANGDLLVGSGPDAATRLGLGAVDQVLTVDPAATLGLAWKAPVPTLVNPMTTADDLMKGGAGGAPTRLGKGAEGFVLSVVGGVLTWAAGTSGMTNPMTLPEDVIKGGSSGAPVRLAKGADGTVLSVVAGVLTWAAPAVVTRYGALEFTLGDGVNAILATEPAQWIELPNDGTLTQATLTADAAGSIVCDVQVATYAAYPPTAAQSICAAAKPTLAAALTSRDATLIGWTTALTRGQYMRVVVNSASVVKRVVLSLAFQGV